MNTDETIKKLLQSHVPGDMLIAFELIRTKEQMDKFAMEVGSHKSMTVQEVEAANAKFGRDGWGWIKYAHEQLDSSKFVDEEISLRLLSNYGK